MSTYAFSRLSLTGLGFHFCQEYVFAYSESKLISYFVVVGVGVGVVGRKVEKVGKRSEDIIGRS